MDPYSHRYRNGEYSFSWHRNGANINEKGHATDLVANEAINWMRSEEHTSELQSLVNLVCRLLLEKKKKTTNTKPRSLKVFYTSSPYPCVER